MQLTIVRHGEAEAYLSEGQDAKRVLTDKGTADISALAKHWPHAKPDACWASPYQRTQQTASLLQQSVAFGSITTKSLLTPEASLNDLLEALALCPAKHLLMVSHQPLVSRLLALLIAGHSRYALDYPMMPGSIATLELPAAAAGLATLTSLQHAPYE